MKYDFTFNPLKWCLWSLIILFSAKIPRVFNVSSNGPGGKAHKDLMGLYFLMEKTHNNKSVWKQRGEGYLYFYDSSFYWTISKSIKKVGNITTDLQYLEAPPVTGWEVYINESWVNDPQMKVKEVDRTGINTRYGDTTPGNGTFPTLVVVGAAGGALLVIASTIAMFFCCRKNRNIRNSGGQQEPVQEIWEPKPAVNKTKLEKRQEESTNYSIDYDEPEYIDQ